MRRLLAIAVLVLAACSPSKPKHTKESVTPLLQKEAESLKADGEKMPDVGVKTNWNINAVEVKEQAGNANQPFTGTIRFSIVSSTQDFDGSRSGSFDKNFNYVFDAASGKWQMRP